MGKKKIIKKYEQLTPEIYKAIKETYPDGFEEELISIPLPSGELALALPFETENVSYLIKMPNNSIPEDNDEDDSNTSELGSFESLDAAQEIPDED